MISFIEKLTRNITDIPLFLKKIRSFHIQQYNYALLGKLSASIIHDILTPITSLSLTTQLQKSHTTQKVISDSTSQIKEFVEIMRDFLKKQDIDQVIHVNVEILKSIKLISHKALQHGVQIQFLEFDQIYTRAHPLYIYQIIVNLLSNAIDASSSSSIKKVILILKKEGDSFCIECKDFGTGIQPEILKDIYKLNFTTKKDGLGFGLYSVQHIIKQYLYGDLKIYSEPNKGSLFFCSCPIRK